MPETASAPPSETAPAPGGLASLGIAPRTVPAPGAASEARARQTERIGHASREATVGLLAVGSGFLKAIHEASPKLREHLVSMATEKPDRAIALLLDLSKVVESAVRSGERLAHLQLTADGVPSSIARVEHATPPPAERLTDDEVRRRAAIIWATVEERNRINAAEESNTGDANTIEGEIVTP